MSLSLAIAPVLLGDVKLNILDTPGYADFFGEVRAAASVADLAVVVVSAVEGIEAQTEAAWELAAELGLPRLVFVNKLDRERASFDRTLGALRERFGAGIAPLELPVGEESGFRGIADLLTDTAIIYEGGKPQSGPIPDDLAATEHEVREQLVEGIVVGDDALMERYLDGETPSGAELEATLAHGVAQGLVFPVVCGSAVTGVGIDRLATLAGRDRPQSRLPSRRGGRVPATRCRRWRATPPASPWPGCSRPSPTPTWARSRCCACCRGRSSPTPCSPTPAPTPTSAPHSCSSCGARKPSPCEAARPATSWPCPSSPTPPPATPWRPRARPSWCPPRRPSPCVLAVAIRPKSKGDEDKLMTGLHRLQEEDPALVVERVDETHQTILRGTGETHLAVAAERLARKFGVEVATEDVLVPYRETITQQAEAEGKYKKQTGGHGQFGVASIRIEPLERGEGFHFVDQVVGGAIPKQYIPAVEKGVVEAMGQGGVHGYPVVDVQVTCFDGKYHPVDSSEMSFKMAGSLAFKEAMAKAGPVLLEPISLHRGHRARHHAGRRPRRPQLAPGPGPGHRHRRRRPAADHRPRAHRRDPALRRGPALAHRRPGPVPRRARPLRRHARQPRRAHGQGQGRLTGEPPSRLSPGPAEPRAGWAAPPGAQGAGQARCRRSHPTASDSGMTRTPATEVMKFVSPDHRGSDVQVQVRRGSPPRRRGPGWRPC